MKTPALHELREDNMCFQKLQTFYNDNEDDDDCAELIIGHLQERIIGQRKKRPVNRAPWDMWIWPNLFIFIF